MSLLITDAGIAASIRAGELGISYKIAEISIGTEGYTPTKDQTALHNEVQRKAITRGEVAELGQLHFETTWDGNEAFEGKELGYWLDDGTLFAVDSRDGEVITYKQQNSVITEACELNLAASTIENITVEMLNPYSATEEREGLVKISNDYTGVSETVVVTEKALSSGLSQRLSRDDKATLTDDDGQGDANLVFNHKGGIPQQNGSAYRLETSTNNNTARVSFRMAGNAVAGVAKTLTTVFEATLSKFNFKVDLYEKGGRVFSPNNRNISDSIDSESSTQYASSKAINTVKSILTLGFSIQLGTNGFVVLPQYLGGLIIQWGAGNAAAESSPSGVQNPLPMTFPNTCYCAIATHYGLSALNTNVIITDYGRSAIGLKSAYTSKQISTFYIAIGD